MNSPNFKPKRVATHTDSPTIEWTLLFFWHSVTESWIATWNQKIDDSLLKWINLKTLYLCTTKNKKAMVPQNAEMTGKIGEISNGQYKRGK